MRKTLALIPIAIAAALAAPAGAAPITRLTSPAPALILKGAIVPKGAETFYLSGQLGSPADPKAEWGDTKAQAIGCFQKIKEILESKGYKMSDVVKMTIFAAGDPKLGGKMDFPAINEAFKMYFGTAENPNTVARSTVQVAALASPAALVEIEVIAAK